MLKNTLAVIDKIILDINNLVLSIRHLFHIVLILPPLFSVLTMELLWVNVPLLFLSIVHYIFFICTYGKNDQITKKVIKEEKKIYATMRNIIRAIALISSIIAIYLATETPNIFLIASAIITIISLLLNITVESVKNFVESRKQMLVDAIKMDFEVITKPIETAVDKVAQIFVPQKAEKTKESKMKYRNKIAELAAKRQEKIDKKREEKKLDKEGKKVKSTKQKLLLHK